MLAYLEDPYRDPETPDSIDGIVVLGGGIDWLATAGRDQIELADAADRLISGVRLALQHPDAVLVFSGRESQSKNESAVAEFFTNLGVKENQLVIESESRSTSENAHRVADLNLIQNNEQWVLVTSAFHMRRAVATFNKSNLSIIPYATDFRSPGLDENSPWFYDSLNYLANVNLAVKEWIGLAAYRLSGRAETIPP